MWEARDGGNSDSESRHKGEEAYEMLREAIEYKDKLYWEGKWLQVNLLQ
jgi:hypothetical protein